MKHLPLGRAGRGLVFSSLLIVAACSPDGRPAAPRRLPLFAISDAAPAGAAPGFFFLPPMAPQPKLSGTFDADITTLDPRIAICDITTDPDVMSQMAIRGSSVVMSASNVPLSFGWGAIGGRKKKPGAAPAGAASEMAKSGRRRGAAGL